MAVRMWDEMTWEEMRDLPRSATVAILPVGAIEAHGPHLPLATDLIISSAMAARGASNLAARGVEAVILPALPYGAAPFAAAFPGTIPVNASTVAALVTEIGTALRAQSLHWLAVANAHLDPAHLDSLRAAAREASERDSVRIIFPDLTEKPWALRLGEEFRSGACHAGRFESSIIMAARPALVQDATRRDLPAVTASLSRAIRAGHRDFAAAGGPRAYFGAPADASREEGEAMIAVLGAILEEAVIAAMMEDGAGASRLRPERQS